MADDAVLDGHASVLVTEVLQEVWHVAGRAVDYRGAVVGETVLVLRKRFLKLNELVVE